MTEALAFKSKMTIGGQYVEFVSHSIRQTTDILPDDGIRGTRSRVLERLALGNVHVAGNIVFEPTPVEVAILLPYAIGSTSTATTLNDAMTDVTVVIDSGTVLDTYVGRFNKITFAGEPGQKLKCTVDFIGKTRTPGTGGTLGGTPDLTVRSYVTTDMGTGLTINSTAYAIDRFEFSIDNRISPTFMGSSTTATDLEPTDRIVLVSVQTRYNAAENALLILNESGPIIASPIVASIAFTNGTNSMAFAFGALVAAPETVVIPSREAKLRLPLNYQAFRVSTNAEVVPTLM